jgi:DNA-binding LacI/PurR family transcriptional regulator
LPKAFLHICRQEVRVVPEAVMGIRQLAEELHLSIGTVSRALNDRPDVNPETRARVKAAAVRLGYVPNQSGRSLRSGRTGIVAVVIPTQGTPRADSGLFSVLEGARRTLLRHSLDLIVILRGPDEDPLESLQRIVQRRIADAIIVSQTTAADPRIAYLSAAGIDYVAFGRSAGVPDCPYVDFDFDSAGAEAARIFVGGGHRRLALAANEVPMNYEDLLLASLRAEAVRLGLRPDAVEHLPVRGARLTAAGRAALARADRPTAVLAAHESFAAGLYGDLADAGLRVGDDVSVICTFPTLDTRTLVPTLSYFDADLDAAGIALAEQLIALLPDGRAERRRPPSTLVPLRFVAGVSHRPAPEPVG